MIMIYQYYYYYYLTPSVTSVTSTQNTEKTLLETFVPFVTGFGPNTPLFQHNPEGQKSTRKKNTRIWTNQIFTFAFPSSSTWA